MRDKDAANPDPPNPSVIRPSTAGPSHPSLVDGHGALAEHRASVGGLRQFWEFLGLRGYDWVDLGVEELGFRKGCSRDQVATFLEDADQPFAQ